MPDSLPELEVERRKILLQFTCLGDLRTGSICAVTRRCGKPTCQCARPDDPGQLASLGVTVPDLVKALEQQNTVNPSGQVGAEPAPPGQEFTYTMRAQGRLVTEQDFGDVVIRENKDGSVVRMKDVARIELGTQTYNVIGRLNDAPAAIIN